MRDAMDFSGQWLVWGAVIIFLVVCVWHNRRVGYQRVRAEKITLGEAMARIKQSLSFSEEALSVASRPSNAPIATTTAEQLVCLNSALGGQINEIGAQVQHEATIEEPAIGKVVSAVHR
jgi:hypothetical protein